MSDEIEFEYQTAKWGKPARLALAEVARDGSTATIEATLLDADGVLCLDAKNSVRFSLAGSGRLIDNLGTSTGSRVVQLYNGRARITLATQRRRVDRWRDQRRHCARVCDCFSLRGQLHAGSCGEAPLTTSVLQKTHRRPETGPDSSN